ncbi:MAG: hypothetical protein U1E65_21850 [Myxococcota bacterium]
MAKAWIQLIAGGALTLLGCDRDFLVDGPPIAEAKVMSYFVSSGTAVLSGRVLAGGPRPGVLELAGAFGPDVQVTAQAYQVSANSLGFVPGELRADPDGAVVPDGDPVFVTRKGTYAWEPAALASPIVRGFRAHVQPPSACPNKSIQTFSAPSRMFYVNDDRPPVLAVSRSLALIILVPEKVVSIHEDWSATNHELPKQGLDGLVVTGTTALIRNEGCVEKFVVTSTGGFKLVPWVCGVEHGQLVPGSDGSFAVVTQRAGSKVDIYGPDGHLRLSYAVEGTSGKFDQLVGDDLFGTATTQVSSKVSHASEVGYVDEFPSGAGLASNSLATVRGNVYVSTSAGEVFVREAGGTWKSLGDSRVDWINNIVGTPRGILVTGLDSANEFIDDVGWCTPLDISNHRYPAVVRLGNQYGLYNSNRDDHLLLDFSP